MKKNILVPVVLLATTPFVVACTKKPTDMLPPPPVTGTTETVTPVESTPNVTPQVTPTTPTDNNSQSGVSTSALNTVTRTERVTYKSPASPEDPIEFSVTIVDGTITAASATPQSDNDISKKLQTSFAGEVATKVIGKKAADFDVDAIGGASLTTMAFENFVRSF